MLRILVAHNRYLFRGGEDTVTDAEIDLLRSHGHYVELYETQSVAPLGLSGKLRQSFSATWSFSTSADISNMLSNGKFDILHVQNFFPNISPAIYYAASKFRVPVVQSIHNYRLICPSANLFRDGKHCEECVGKSFAWPGIRHGCYHDSRLATGAVAMMESAHRALGTWNSKVDTYVALTNYVRKQLVRGGVDADKIVVKPNFVSDPYGKQISKSPDAFVLFVGRLAPEKGLLTLLKAKALSKVPYQIKIAGDGPLFEAVSSMQIPGVELLGEVSSSKVSELMGEAAVVVVPGSWAEPFGRVIIEAFAASTPVIASDVGGIPELVTNDHDGLLVPPGDAASLSDRLDSIMTDTETRCRLSAGARATYERYYTPQENYNTLIKIYEHAIGWRVFPEVSS